MVEGEGLPLVRTSLLTTPSNGGLAPVTPPNHRSKICLEK